LEPPRGIEPRTYALRASRSTVRVRPGLMRPYGQCTTILPCQKHILAVPGCADPGARIVSRRWFVMAIPGCRREFGGILGARARPTGARWCWRRAIPNVKPASSIVVPGVSCGDQSRSTDLGTQVRLTCHHHGERALLCRTSSVQRESDRTGLTGRRWCLSGELRVPTAETDVNGRLSNGESVQTCAGLAGSRLLTCSADRRPTPPRPAGRSAAAITGSTFATRLSGILDSSTNREGHEVSAASKGFGPR